MIEINKLLSKIGCCEACILRYVGSKNPLFFSDAEGSVTKMGLCRDNSEDDTDEPQSKKRKLSPCICCLGLLQKEFWPNMLEKIKIEVDESNYESDTFACALTPPHCILLREHSINLYLIEELPKWKPDNITSLKEAWKWSFGCKMAETIGKTMDSGAVCQFLIKANITYNQEMEELQSLRSMCPEYFEERERSHRKFHGETFTRKGIENLLYNIEPEVFRQYYRCPPDTPKSNVECTSVECSHLPIYLAGRYCKYSRELCQTPWILDGKRMMESSIQDIIFDPLVRLYNIPIEESTKRLKFLSSGREDVDVRCLGEGRPFAIEISDPRGAKLDKSTLKSLCEEMGKDKSLITVKDLQIVSREELTILKMGEETKTKTYVALCFKLETEEHLDVECNNTGSQNGCHLNNIQDGASLLTNISHITYEDLEKLNTFSNTDDGEILIKQKTPLRVLHRRPLLIRDKTIHMLKGSLIPGKSNLFTVEMTTQAGTYIKEFVHGDFGRTKPSMTDILGFKVDILALDVKSINLDWPKKIDP